MYRLAIDTATAVGSIALAAGDRVIAERSVEPRQGAGGLVPAIHECLEAGGIGVGDLDEVLLADGPGSFTGLRVGFATVAGLVTGRPVPVRTVASLVATAWGMGRRAGVIRTVVAMYDALRGEVFAVRCAVSPDACNLIEPPRLTRVSEVAGSGPPPDLVVAGDPGLLGDVGAVWSGVEMVESPDAVRAVHLLGLAAVPGAVPQADPNPPVHPTYGRLAEAQVRWERKHGRPISDSSGHRR